MQSGGPVSAGDSLLIGERGPELFVPGRSGTIIPSGRFGGVTIMIDARGADGGVEHQIRTTIQEMTPGIISAAMAASTDAAARGGASRRFTRG